MLRRIVFILSFLMIFSFISSTANAQWVTQTLSLQKGWNAVFLEVDPYPKECKWLFQDLPVKSVWYYDQRFSPIQFIQDPSELSPDDPKWLSYFPSNRPESVATNLYSLDVGKSYLIEMEEPMTWSVTGKPEFFHQVWNPDSYNLTGFFVDPQKAPTLATWFASSLAHIPLEVWTLNAEQKWVALSGETPIESGKAYWVKCTGTSDYQGPVEIRLLEGKELRFERDYTERLFEIKHKGSGTAAITLDWVASLPVPSAISGTDTSTLIPLAGNVPLKIHGKRIQGEQEEFTLLGLPVVLDFPDGETAPKPIRLVVDRSQMGVYGGTGDALYQNILLIRDDQGFMRKIGVNSRSRYIGKSASSAKMRSRQSATTDPFAGLWIGSVVLDQVQEPNLSVTTETPAPFRFRILFHVDAEGKIRFLNEITLLWRDGTYKPDPQPGFPNAKTIDQPGYYILVTPTAPASLLDELRVGEDVHATALKDGRAFARRISTAMFSLLDENHKPETPLMQQSGEFGKQGSQLTIQLVLEDTDPLNPFHHQFHPQHAYPDEGTIPTGNNDWTISRSITLEFSDTPPDQTPLAGWGDTALGGLYTEVIEGLKKEPIIVEGSFTVNQVADIPVLNDGLTQ